MMFPVAVHFHYIMSLWTVSVKAGQSELNEASVTSELHTNEGSHVTFLNLYIDVRNKNDDKCMFMITS